MRTLPITLLAGATLMLAACGPAEEPAEETPDAVEAPPEAAEEPADVPAEDVVLRLLTHDSFDVSTEVLESFEQETGIEVEVIPSGDAGTTLNQAILTKDSPQGDLLFGVDNTFLSRALDEELFLSYRSPRLDVVPEAYQLDPEDRATPIDVGDVCLNYDVAWFDENDVPVPDDLADLTDERYRGLLAVQNPATSSPGLAFLLATVERFGEDGYLDFWADLRDNDVVVTDGWSEAYYDEFSGAGDGDRSLVVSYASSPPAEVFFADPQPDEAPTGVIEASCFRQIEFVGILATTEHPDEAKLLVDFMLSPTFQEDIPLRMFVFPVAEDAELPEVFVEHAQLPDEPFELDPFVIGENREAWIDEWTRTVLR
jgi:thiamine transport system substrate-binding protein